MTIHMKWYAFYIHMRTYLMHTYDHTYEIVCVLHTYVQGVHDDPADFQCEAKKR